MIETKFVCLKYLFLCICFQIFATPKSLVCFPAIPETKDETTCRKYNKRCCLRSFIFTSSLVPSVPMFTTIMAIFFYLLRAKLVFELCEDLVWFILIWFYTTSKIFWTFFGSFCRIIFGNSEAVAGISFFSYFVQMIFHEKIQTSYRHTFFSVFDYQDSGAIWYLKSDTGL